MKNITLKKLKEKNFDVHKDGDQGHTCYHNGTDIQILREADGQFWTVIAGVDIDLNKMSEVDKIIDFVKKITK